MDTTNAGARDATASGGTASGESRDPKSAMIEIAERLTQLVRELKRHKVD